MEAVDLKNEAFSFFLMSQLHPRSISLHSRSSKDSMSPQDFMDNVMIASTYYMCMFTLSRAPTNPPLCNIKTMIYQDITKCTDYQAASLHR